MAPVLACDLLNDGFYHVEGSSRDPTGLLDALLGKVRFSCRAGTLTSVPCTSYNRIPVFGFAAALNSSDAPSLHLILACAAQISYLRCIVVPHEPV